MSRYVGRAVALVARPASLNSVAMVAAGLTSEVPGALVMTMTPHAS